MLNWLRTTFTILSSLSLLLSSIPLHLLASQPVEISEVLTSLNNFSSLIYGTENNGKPGLLQNVQTVFKAADTDDESSITMQDFNLKPILNKLRSLQTTITNTLDQEELEEEVINNLILSSFAYIDIPFYEFLSIWKSKDQLAYRYQLQQEYRSQFSIEFLSDKLKEQSKMMNFLIIENDNATFSFKLAPFEQLKKELQVSIQIPAVHTYLKATRLMALQMMLQQQSLYQGYLGNSDEVTIPQSCQEVSFTKLPESYTFEMPSAETRQTMITNMLINNGLIAGTDIYRENFLESSNPHLASGSVTQILPFQQHSLATQAIKKPQSISIDDLSTFDNVLALKESALIALFDRENKRSKQRACGGRNCADRMSKASITKIEKIMFKMIQFSNPAWIIKQNGKTITVDTEAYNAYIIDQLKLQNKKSWTSIMPVSLKNRLQNRQVSINFPLQGAPSLWNSWSLRKIYSSLKKTSTKQRSTILARTCKQESSSICQRKDVRRFDGQQTYKNLMVILSEFDQSNDYLPELLKNEDFYKSNNKFFQQLWKQLVAQGLLDNKLNQFNLLSNQFNSYNHWAALYFSFQHIISTNNFSNLEKRLLKKVGQTLGVDKDFSPFMADTLLTKNEKKSLWKQILNQANEKNGYLFNQDSPLQHQQINYYEMINNLAQKNIFSSDSILNTIDSFDKQADIIPMYSTIKQLQKGPGFKKIQLLQQLYNTKGNLEKQEQIAEILIQMDAEGKDSTNEWDSFNSIGSNDIKTLYLEMDNKIKSPLYTYLVQDAAALRLRQIKDKIKYLCSRSEDGIDDLKDIYYSTAKAQMQLNSQFGIQPNSKVQEFLGKYNKNEKSSLWFGLGSAALFIGSTILGAGCTVVTGGLCMPLTAAVLAGLATGTQVFVANIEFQESIDANHRASELAEFEQLGLTDHDSVSQVERSYLWGVMEIAFTIPLIGQLGRGIEIGHKMVKANLKGALKGASKLEKKLFYKSITEQVNAKYAKHILGFSSLSIELKSSFKQLFKNKSTTKLMNQAFDTGKVVMTQSPKEIDNAFASSVMKFFNNNPKKFSKFLQQYSDKEITLSKQLLEKLAIYEHPEDLSKLRRIWGKFLPQMKIKRLQAFLKQEKSLKEIAAQVSKREGSSQELTKFISEHADSFSLIFESLPFQKKELPHMMIALGGPVFRSRVPLYSRLTEVTILKRISSARNLLRKESLREIAQNTLGLPKGISYHQTYALYNSFQQSVLQHAAINNPVTAKRLEKLNHKIFANALGYLKQKGFQGNQTDLRRILFTPQSIDESVQAQNIWNMVPAEKLFKFSSEDKFLTQMVKEFQNPTGLNQFQDFVHALKLLSISKTPELANIL